MQEAVPIITANFQPLRFVIRGDSDAWSPTLEQINGREYDYVKLHRLSTYVDVGISPYSLGICFDGTLLLPDLPRYKDRSVALSLFNKTLTELLVGGIYCEAVTPDDLGYGVLSFTSYARILSGGRGPAASLHKAARTRHIGTLDVISLLKPEMVTIEKLTSSLSSGRRLLAKLGDIPLEQVLYGTTFYVRKQWAESLIHIWTTTERIVELAWQKHVVLSNGIPTKKRRAFLDDHRTWSASAKLEVLFQKSLLPAEVLATLDEVRKARNDFAHRGLVPSHEIATKALVGCFQLAALSASEFQDKELFNELVASVIQRGSPSPHSQQSKNQQIEVSHWLPLPPLPGDEEWGDKPYEVIDELRLAPINGAA